MPTNHAPLRRARTFLATRRDFLRGAAAACLPAALPWAVTLAASSAPPAPRKPLIDVHHHWYDMDLLHWWGRDALDPNWATAAALAGMDEGGISTAMLSVTLPGIWKSSDVAGSVKLARHCNEQMAQTVRDHPGRFGLIAALPLPQTDAALAEIAYALDVLHADAIGLLSSYENHYLGEAQFAPVFEELNRRKAVVYVHPNAPMCCTSLVPGVGPGALEAPTDTARAVESLLITGTLSRLTGVQWLVGAGGGTLPFVGDRLLNAATQAGQKAPEADKMYFAPDTLRTALGRLNLDTAGMTLLPEWAALMHYTSPSRLLFGTDFPFSVGAASVAQLRAMEEEFGLPPSARQDIEYGNAQRLFPARLKA